MPLLLTPSPRLMPLPAGGTALVVTPASYANWDAMFNANPTIRRFRLTPGDYTPWGELKFVPAWAGTADAWRVVEYYNPGVDDHLHPSQRSNHALVGRQYFRGSILGVGNDTNQPAYIHFHGLTSRNMAQGNAWDSGSLRGMAHIVWDWFLIEGLDQPDRSIGIYSNNVTVQRGLLRDPGPSALDCPAIVIKPLLDPIVDFAVLDVEVKDYNDGFALTNNQGDDYHSSNGVFDGCEAYITDLSINDDGVTSITENGIDIKTGSDDPEGIQVTNCRFWGFRTTLRPGGIVTSDGSAMACHRYAKNVTFENVIVDDAPMGLTELSYAADIPIDEDTPRNIKVRNCQFLNIRQYSGTDIGACTRSRGTMEFTDCRFARSDYVVYKHVEYRPGPPTFEGSVRIGTEVFHPSSNGYPGDNPYVEELNAVVGAPARYDTYERKRWTGREFAPSTYPGGGHMPLSTGSELITPHMPVPA